MANINYQELLWLVKRTCTMDKKLLLNNKTLSLEKKLEIIYKKYKSLAKHWIYPFEHGKSFETIGNEKVYYNSPFGIAGYQDVLAEHMPSLGSLDIRNNPTIIDVGANVGYFSIGCAKTWEKAHIYALEPGKTAFQALVENTKGHKQIKNFNIGAGEKNENIILFSNEETAKASALKEKEINYENKEEITVVTLEEFVRKNKIEGIIDVLKIDVEGYEIQVLKGAKNILDKVKYIHIEVNQEDYPISEIFKAINRKCKIVYVRNFSNNQEDKLVSSDMILELL